VFGSTVRGAAGPLSDIDVGLLLLAGTNEEEVVGRVTDALARRLRTDRVHVVSLTSMPAPVRFRALREGVRVAERDRAVRVRFAVETVRHYLDFQPIRQLALTNVRKSILGGT
jgi:predicted nucleotidyltransferase